MLRAFWESLKPLVFPMLILAIVSVIPNLLQSGLMFSTSSLMPFEIYEIARKPSPLRIAILVLNAGIVIYLIIALRKEHQVRGRRSA